MPNKPVLIHLIVWILFQIQNIYTFKDDEHYCKGAFDSYSYCRRCPNSTMFCEAPKSCHCDDIEIFSNHRKLKKCMAYLYSLISSDRDLKSPIPQILPKQVLFLFTYVPILFYLAHPTNEDEVIGYQGGAICDGYDVPSK